MKRILGVNSFLWSGALAALAAQPGLAASTVITGVRINETPTGVEIVLNTQGGNESRVFAVNQGNVLRADITRAQLNLPSGGEFRQVNPALGIAAISVVSLDANSVRLTVEGTNQVPVGTVQPSDTGTMIFAVQANGAAAQAPTVIPSSIETVPDQAPRPTAQASREGDAVPAQATLAQASPAQPAPVQPAPAQPAPAQPTPVQTEARPDVLVPNPDISIDGVPVPQPQNLQAPPFLPRAVAPPVGDIAVADGNPAFPDIELDSNERIPKLVLRNAPAREVLSLLARAAGLNLVFTSEGGGGTDGAAAPAGGTGGADGPTVTLDIENESVQDVFNHVLRVSGLEANRVGRSIYVGPALPISAQNVAVRTLRLNQVEAAVASNFLVALGAESAVSRERLVTNVNAVAVGEGTAPVTQTATTTVEQVETQRVDYTDGTPILRGLQVVADERTNSVTLVGTPTLVAIATEQLTRIDIRRRQVAINVRVIDVNLNALDASGTSFSFATGDISLGSTGGIGVVNFGATTPATVGSTIPGGTPIIPRAFGGGIPGFAPLQFLANLLATVQSGNAKILTDPTLIVQEGQTATVQLTEEVITNVEATTQVTNGVSVTTLNVEKEPAGLILQIDVNRIDDNGFVSLSVAPSISAPANSLAVSGTTITLLAERLLSSGQVRVRDGQTLLLSGIIQDADRTTVTKVPILGDLPLLGALFRSTTNSNQRRELIVLLTPEVLDDSDQAVYGYSYTPSEEVQDLLEQYR